MRQNLPVTQREYPFPSGQTLVSTTDTDGRIRHCNAAFVAVSGFRADELIGQPHNIIRHPDTPAEAFRDMWATVRSGLPWSGLIKNRRQDGDHYWVVANVTPLMEGGRPMGYMSVRTEPTRAQVEEAQALYRLLHQQAAMPRPQWRLSGGRLQRTGWRGAWQRASAKVSAADAQLLAAVLLAGAAGWGLSLLPRQAQALAVPAMLLIGLGAAWWIRRQTVAALRPLGDYALRLAAGDLTRPPLGAAAGWTGTLRQALRQLDVNLRSIVADARSEAGELIGVAGEIAAGNTDLSDRTSAQAGNVQQTAATMEQATSGPRRRRPSRRPSGHAARVASRSTAARWRRRWPRPCGPSSRRRGALPRSSR